MKSKTQGAVVGTVAMAMMTVGASVAAVLSWMNAEKSQAELAAMAFRANELSTKIAERNETISFLADRVGQVGVTEPSALKKLVSLDLARRGTDGNYPLMIDRLNIRLKAEQGKAERLERDLLVQKQRAENAGPRFQAKFDEIEKALAAKTKEVLEEQKRGHELLAGLEKQVADLQGRLEDANSKRRQAERDREVAQGKADEKIRSLSSNMRKLKDTVNAATGIDESAIRKEAVFGRVAGVDTRNRRVTITGGRAEGVLRGMFVKLYRPDGNGKPGEEVARVEIVALEEHRCEARIAENKITVPILQGDLALSALVRQGQSEVVALVGFLDYDGDGQDDADRLQRMIEQQGGRVDCRIDATGAKKGRISPRLTYVVMDDVEVGDGEAGTKRGLVQQLSAVRKEAVELGVKIISAKKFVDEIGFKRDLRASNP